MGQVLSISFKELIQVLLGMCYFLLNFQRNNIFQGTYYGTLSKVRNRRIITVSIDNPSSGAVTPMPSEFQQNCQYPKPVLLNTVIWMLRQCLLSITTSYLFSPGICPFTIRVGPKQSQYSDASCWKFRYVLSWSMFWSKWTTSGSSLLSVMLIVPGRMKRFLLLISLRSEELWWTRQGNSQQWLVVAFGQLSLLHLASYPFTHPFLD